MKIKAAQNATVFIVDSMPSEIEAGIGSVVIIASSSEQIIALYEQYTSHKERTINASRT